MVNAPFDFRQMVIWEDESLVAINKPAGLLTIRDGYDPELPYVTSLAMPFYGKLWVIHRLDKETSGVLLLARSAEAHKILNTQFESRSVHKSYHALVFGQPPWQEQTVELPLRVNGDRRHRTVVDPKNGKQAFTIFKVLERFEATTLLEANPQTGYTHQIRAHLFALGYPIVGDTLYALKERKPINSLQRVGLHAFRIEFEHPTDRRLVIIEAPYPTDFLKAVKIQINTPRE